MDIPTFDELFIRLLALEDAVFVKNHNPENPKDDEYFMEIWNAWPTHRSDGAPARGNRAKAYRAYLKCVCQKYTPEILTEAVAQYLMALPDDTKYIQQVSTFFGPTKRTWQEWADRTIESQENP